VADAFGFFVMFMSVTTLPLLGIWSLSWIRNRAGGYVDDTA
jgi:hypothetical protein